jgi:acetylglutamate kinase
MDCRYYVQNAITEKRMTIKQIEHLFKNYKEDKGVSIEIVGDEIRAINKYTKIRHIFVNNVDAIRITDKKTMDRIREYLGKK